MAFCSIKRLFLCAQIIVLSSALLFAQDTPLKQYQTFSWQPVYNARKYEVTVQPQIKEGVWGKSIVETTVKSNLEMLLLPGTYRVSIATYNVLNKKSSTSPWVTFLILDDTEPFIYPSTFTTDIGTSVHRYDADVVEEAFRAGSTYTEAKPNSNVIYILGKNIFFPETTFILKPAEATANAGIAPANPYRKEIPLTIIGRDREKETVIVSYDDNLLSTGYWILEVHNPKNKTASIDVNVFAPKKIVLDSSLFKTDAHYNKPTAVLTKQSNATFVVRGDFLYKDTQFSLVPDTQNQYLFGSTQPLVTVPLTQKKISFDTNGRTAEVELSYESALVADGFYLLTAQNKYAPAAEQQILITVDAEANNAAPVVEKIKSKYDKAKGTLTITATGKRFNKTATALIISQSPIGTKGSQRMALTTTKANKRSAVFTADASALSPGTYALLVEVNKMTAVTYISIDEAHNVTILDQADAQLKESFFAGKESPTTATQTSLPETKENKSSSKKSDAPWRAFEMIGAFGFYAEQNSTAKKGPAGSVSIRADINRNLFFCSDFRISITNFGLDTQDDETYLLNNIQNNFDIEIAYYNSKEATFRYYFGTGAGLYSLFHGDVGEEVRETPDYHLSIPLFAGVEWNHFDFKLQADTLYALTSTDDTASRFKEAVTVQVGYTFDTTMLAVLLRNLFFK